MASLTLVPETLAEKGYRFFFHGPNDGPECESCPVRLLCFRIPAGRHYEVTQVRKVTHPCDLHEGERVQVCLVEEVPFETTLERKHLRGTAARWDPVPCGYPECPQYALCHPVGPAKGAKYTIKETGDKVDCPMHYDIARVVLEPVE